MARMMPEPTLTRATPKSSRRATLGAFAARQNIHRKFQRFHHAADGVLVGKPRQKNAIRAGGDVGAQTLAGALEARGGVADLRQVNVGARVDHHFHPHAIGHAAHRGDFFELACPSP